MFSPVATETDRCKLGSSEESVANEHSSDCFSRTDNKFKQANPRKPPTLVCQHSFYCCCVLYFHTFDFAWTGRNRKKQRQNHSVRSLTEENLGAKHSFPGGEDTVRAKFHCTLINQRPSDAWPEGLMLFALLSQSKPQGGHQVKPHCPGPGPQRTRGDWKCRCSRCANAQHLIWECSKNAVRTSTFTEPSLSASPHSQFFTASEGRSSYGLWSTVTHRDLG